MTFEDELRRRLQQLDYPASDVDGEALARAGRSRRRRRTTAFIGAAGAAAAVAVIVPLASVGAGGSRSAIGIPPPSRSSASDSLAAAFHIAAPQIQLVLGPVPQRRPPCRPTDVVARAEFRPTPSGDAGVISMVGKNCSLHIATGPTRFLDQHGASLSIPFAAPLGIVNPPENPRPDLALNGGVANWGFLWVGSWCGARPATIEVPLVDAPDEGGADYGTLRIPVVGTSLGCEGRSNARVVVGVAGREGEGVLPPSPALSSLRLHLSVPGRAAHGGLVDGVVLTIRNAGTAPVRLDPCPYLALVTDAHGVSGTEEDGSSLLLPCDRASVVAGGDEARFALPPLQYGEGAPTGHGGLRTGERVTINVAIASLPTASATTQVD